MKLTKPKLIFAERYFITNSVSFLVSLFSYSVSSWVSFNYIFLSRIFFSFYLNCLIFYIKFSIILFLYAMPISIGQLIIVPFSFWVWSFVSSLFFLSQVYQFNQSFKTINFLLYWFSLLLFCFLFHWFVFWCATFPSFWLLWI